MSAEILAQVLALRDRGALFAVNDSGGKDSQATKLIVRALVPRDQIVVIHAHLGRVEWPDTIAHIERYNDGIPFIVCRNENRDLLQTVHDRKAFPSPKYRQCTSDQKRGPIEREIRRYLKANPRFRGIVVDCQGMREQESDNRAKLNPFQRGNDDQNAAGREWWRWLPVFRASEAEVFDCIRDNGQVPHYAYLLGLKRVSCCLCIFMPDEQLRLAATLRPRLYAEYCHAERVTGFAMIMPRKGKPVRFLPEITGIEPMPYTPGMGEGETVTA